MHIDDDLRARYLEHFQRSSPETEKAWDTIRDLSESNPRGAFEFFLSLLPLLNESQLLATVGIDILEPLLRYRAAEMSEEVLVEAQTNERLREALRSVYVGEGQAELRERLDRALSARE